MNNGAKKNKSKLTKQPKKNHVLPEQKTESCGKNKPVVGSPGDDCDLPDNTNHSEVSVPSPDDAALPNPSLCPAISVESKELNGVNKCVEKCLISEKSIISDQEVDKQITKKLTDGLEKETLDAKDKKKAPITKKVKNGEKEMKNKLLTDYFQVRRSSRKVFQSIKCQKQNFVKEAILSGSEEGFEVKEYAGKGRGVIANKEIKQGDFVLEYSGELLSFSEAKERELCYESQEDVGCYMYYFKYKDHQLCVDATKENGRLGRLINHSKKGNLKTRPFFIDEYPHLIFIATRDISPGEELLYDYGDRSKKSIESYPWLAT